MVFQKTALIIGVAGQDGFFLREYLLSLDYFVIGVGRNFVTTGNSCTKFSLSSPEDVNILIHSRRPDEIYYLAAHHASSEKVESAGHYDLYRISHSVHVECFLRLLCAVKEFSPHSKVFYASSSLIFDGRNGPIQNELTPYSPNGIYGLTKLQGQYLCQYFREAFNISVSAGILYSHESVRRSSSFLSKKIISTAHLISVGEQKSLAIGSLQSQNDWGYAPDFVKAFKLINDVPRGDDYIIATGCLHSVEEFVDIVFSCFGLDFREYVSEDPSLLVRKSLPRSGDASKIRSATGWKPSLTFGPMVETLVEDYLRSHNSYFCS